MLTVSEEKPPTEPCAPTLQSGAGDLFSKAYLLKLAALASAYYGAGWLGLSLAIPPGFATAVWPPSGIALAGLLVFGYRVWPGIWLGSFLVNIGVSFDGTSTFAIVRSATVAGSIAAGFTLQALLGAWLVGRWIASRRPFERAQDVLRFTAIEALSCLVAASFGVASLSVIGLIDRATYPEVWRTWYLGDLMGILIVAPLALTWSPRPRFTVDPWKLTEAVLSLALLAALTLVLFAGLGDAAYPLAFAVLSSMIWIAYRLGPAPTALGACLVSGIAIGETIHGFGPFARGSVNESLFLLQSFMGIATLTGLTLAGALREREHMEGALEEAQSRYRALVETTPAIIYSADLSDGVKMLYTSPYVETLLGFTPEAWLQDPERWIKQLHPEDRKRILDAFGRSHREGTPFADEYRLLSRTGEVLWFQDHAVIVSDPQSHRRIMYGTIADITARMEVEQAARQTEEEMRRMNEALERRVDDRTTELEQSNAALRRSNEDLDEFAYAASHDLKEPLRGIHHYAQFLLEDYRLDAEAQQKLKTLGRLADRMAALIDSLLEYSRVGRADLAFAQTDLNEVLAEVLDSLAITVKEQGVQVRIPQRLPALRCDRVRIGQVFHNLLSNAIKYNDKVEKSVEIGCQGGRLFCVRDNGIGIPEKHHEAIFRIFRRLHGREQYGGGTGAGLTIVKKIIERHDGRIWLESTPGVGSSFYFTV